MIKRQCMTCTLKNFVNGNGGQMQLEDSKKKLQEYAKSTFMFESEDKNSFLMEKKIIIEEYDVKSI